MANDRRDYLWQHGTSFWATYDEMNEEGYIENAGVILGATRREQDPEPRKPVHAVTYNGDRHLLTVAPTRTGKGTTAIVPALMDHQGALLCIDPKGENAFITAEAREKLHGQTVHILDPWKLATGQLDRQPAQFNPLDMLHPDSEDLADDALMIADALVVPSGGDTHWSDEARAMVMGFILHVVTSPDEEGQRTLGRVREILCLPPNELISLVEGMAKNGTDLVKSAANRFRQKSERELASVISTAQQNTHFLESPNIKTSLDRSTFDFADLKSDDAPISVYLVLPADRLNTHGRWLRLVVSMAITAMVRGGNKPKRPALFLLDEFAALGKLAVVEQAYGLMAGFGMQLWAIIQDLSQLEDLYGRRWQTFLGNAGVLQVFGTRDIMTADYVSRLAGNTTVEKVSQATTEKREGGFLRAADPNFSHMNDQKFGRLLIQPEEVIRLPDFMQLLFLPACNPIECRKVPYFENARYFDLEGYPLFRRPPHYPGAPKFFIWDQETLRRRKNVNEEKIAKERAEREAKRQAEAEARAAARQEALDKAAKVTGEAASQAAKVASKFGKRLLDEARKARDAGKDEPEK